MNIVYHPVSWAFVFITNTAKVAFLVFLKIKMGGCHLGFINQVYALFDALDNYQPLWAVLKPFSYFPLIILSEKSKYCDLFLVVRTVYDKASLLQFILETLVFVFLVTF